MSTEYAMGFVHDVNDLLVPMRVLDAIDFHADKVQHSGETIKAFCPIHKDSRFRSLLVDADRRAFRCTIKTCKGYAGGSILELYALSNEISIIAAASDLVQRLELEMESDWHDHLIASYLNDAKTDIAKGDFTVAETLLRELLTVAPDLPEARIMLASIQAEMGDVHAAAQEYCRLVEHFIATKRLLEAEALVDDAAERFPGNEDLLFMRVRVAEELGQTELAIDRTQQIIGIREAANRHMDNIGLLEQLVEKAPNRTDFPIKLAGLYEQQHNLRGASQQYDNAAKLFLASGNTEEGLKLLEKVLQYNGENIRARLALAQHLAVFGDIEKARYHTFRAVNQQIDQQEFNVAFSTVNNWLQREPDNIDARELLARIFLDQERGDEAAKHLSDGAAIAAGEASHERAADLLLRAKFLLPADALLRRRLITEFQAMGEQQRAAFEMIDLAEILFSSDQPEAALTLLTDGIVGEVSLTLRLQMITALANHNDGDHALEQLRKLIQSVEAVASPDEKADLYALLVRLEPGVLKNHKLLVETLWSISSPRGAEAAADSALSLFAKDQPTDAVAILELAAELLNEYVPEAPRLLHLCEQAERTDLVGAIYQAIIEGFAEEDPEAALKAARRMVVLDPAHPSAPSDIAFLLSSLGRTNEAAEQYAYVARLLRDAGDLENALQYAREGASLNKDSIIALSIQASLAKELLTPEESAPLIEELLRATRDATDPASAELGYLAYAELSPDDDRLLDEAVKSLQRLGAAEGAAQVLAHQAGRLSIKGDWSGARQLLEEASATARPQPQIKEQYGEACRIVGDGDASARAYAEAATAYTGLGDIESAVRCTNSSQVAGPVSPESWEALFNAAEAAGLSAVSRGAAEVLTQLFAASGSPQAVVKWAREYVRLALDNPVAHEALGSALLAVDQPENAALSFSAAASLYLRTEDASRALTVLQQSLSRKLWTPGDQDTLDAILVGEEKTSGNYGPAILLSGLASVHSGDMVAARRVAEEISADSAKADLWLAIAGAEETPSLITTAYLQSAYAFKAAGATEAAILAMQKAVALGDAPVQVHEFLAELLTTNQDFADALPHQLQVVRYLAADKSTKLLPLLTSLRRVYDGDVAALIALATELVSAGLPDMALQDMETAATLAGADSNTAALVTICGLDEKLTRQSGVLTQARADVLMGMENEHQALEWVSSRGRELLESGKSEEALAMAQRWTSLNAADPEAFRLFADASMAVGNSADGIEASLKVAHLLMQSSQHHAALETLQQVLEVSPNIQSALRLKANAQKALNDPTNAAITVAQMAANFEKSDDFVNALTAYREALALSSENTEVQWSHAELVHKVDGASAALPLYRQWANKRRESVNQQQWILDLERLVQIIPESAALLRDLTDTLLKAGHPVDALPYLNKLANLLEAEGDYPGAARTLEETLAHASIADPAQLLIIAELYRKGNSPVLAQDHMRNAARALYAAGNYAEAARVFDDLIKLAGDSTLPEDFSTAAGAHSKSGNAEVAIELLNLALAGLDKHSDDKQLREMLFAQAIEIAPFNASYVTRYIDMLTAGRAMTLGLLSAREMTAAGHLDDAIQVIRHVIAMAPHDMSLRQELLEPLRRAGDTNRLRLELVALAGDALAWGDTDAAIEAMDEAAGLSSSAPHHRILAELNEQARRQDQAAAHFTKAALLFSEDDKKEQAIANINRAVSAKSSAIPADSMAALVRRIGSDLYEVAREQLRAALTARRQKQSQALALALLETSVTPARNIALFKTIYTLAGSTFLVGIAYQRVNALMESGELLLALELVTSLLEMAPDSADAWQLSAQVFSKAEMHADARRSALEAARLYSISGAVSEEEDCYLQAMAAEPANLYVKVTLAEYFVRENRQEEAVALLQEVITAADSQNNSDVLLEALNRAVQLAPSNTDLREKLATLLEVFAPDSAIENWMQTAEIYIAAEQRDRAHRIYDHVLTLQPGNEIALQALLIEAKEGGDLEIIGRLTRKLADVKASRKNFGEACRLLQSYLEIDPDNLEMLEQLSSLSGMSNDVEVFTTTTRALAKKFQKMGDNVNALRHYEMLLVRSPRNTVYLSAILDCCAGAGLADKGLLYAQQLLAVARETEDPERIRLAATTILNYDDSDAGAHNDLGESLLSLNRVSEAVTEWMRAAELYEEVSDIAMAFTCYRRVTQISPGTIHAWKHLGEMAMNIGDIETARMGVFHVLEKASPADSRRIAPLLARLVQALPDDQHVHQTALEFYRRTDDLANGAMEYLWLAKNANACGNQELAESLLAEGTKWAPANQQLKQAHHNMIRQMGRLEELQLRLRREANDHEEDGRSEEAISVLYELVNLAPGQIALHQHLARSLDSVQRPDEALEQHLHVVRLLLERAELEEARDSAEALVKRYPHNIHCREKIAELLVASAYMDLAARYYRAAADAATGADNQERRIDLLNKAVTARPAWVEVRKALARECEEAGKTVEAFEAWIGVIPSLLESGEFSEATDMLDRLSRMRPDSPEVREQLAELYEKTGNRDQQAEVLRELVKIYEKSDRYLEALEAYRKLASIVPDDTAVLTRYVELLSQVETSEKNMPQEYARLADALERGGDFNGALQTYEQILGMAPGNTSARSRYATFLLSQGNRSRALSEMRTLATLYTERKEPAAAVEVLNAALTISPRDADLCLALAAAQEAAGMHEDARVTYSRATAILASTASVKGIDTYRRILTQDENNTAVRMRLVELLLNSGDTMEAAREARILAEIYINRGDMIEAEKAYRIVDKCEPETIDDVRDAIRRDSYDPSLQYVHYVRLGNRLFDAGDIDNALDSFRTARSLHDDQPDIIQRCIDCISLIAPEAEAIPDYLLMAEKLLTSGESAKARQAYEQVRLIDPFNSDARGGLESVNAWNNRGASVDAAQEDDLVLKASRSVNKRVALMDLLVACRDAALDNSDSQKLGR